MATPIKYEDVVNTMNEVSYLRKLFKDQGNGFFGVKFIKANGEPRKMNCRLKVTKHLKGGESTTSHIETLLTVYERNSEGYRSVNLKTVYEYTVNGETVVFNEAIKELAEQ